MSTQSKLKTAFVLIKIVAVLALTAVVFQASANEPGNDDDKPNKPLTCYILPKCKDGRG